MMKKRILRVCLIVFAIPVLFYGIENPVSEGMVALTSLVGEPTRSDKVKAWFGKWHYVLLPDGWLKLWFIHKIEAFRKSHFITSAAPSIPLTYSIWGTSGSDYSNIDTSRKQYFALRNLVAIAAANEAHFLRNGRYADQLTELVPELMPAVPRDPYSGNEFIYFKSGERSNRPVIYSVDQNLTDDGGYRFLKKRMGDLVWQYELPKNFTKEHYLHSKFPRSVID